jgi:putative ABC transport system permease protein
MHQRFMVDGLRNTYQASMILKKSSSAPTLALPVHNLQQVQRTHRLLRPLGALLDVGYLSVLRLRYHLGLSLLSLLGVVLAIGLVSSAAFFAQAVETVIMRQELAEYTRITQRPPFSSRIFNVWTRANPLTIERSETLAGDVSDTLSSEVGLPVRGVGLLADSGVLTLQPKPGDNRYEGKRSLGTLGLVYMAGVDKQLQIDDGAPLDEGASGEALAVWMHAETASELGMQIGDQFDLVSGNDDLVIPIVLTGFWRAADPANADFWFSDPDQTLKEKLFVRRQDYLSHVQARLPVGVRSVTWYVILDEMQARPAYARDYVEGFTTASAVIKKYLPEAQLTLPSVPLEKFVGRQTTLTTILLGFNTPAFGFLLYFLILTSAVIAYWQRRESAILLSRGMTRWGVLSFTLVEGMILFAIAAPVGLAFGMWLARTMGYTVSFLSFRSRAPLPVSMDGLNMPLLLATLGILLLAKLWTAALTSRETVLSQEREHARPPRGPFWYRAYLDILLVIPMLYGYRQLLNRGSLGELVRENPEELYQDPLLIIVPALFVIVASLLAMRLFPWVMRLIDWLAHRTPWLAPHLALRQLGRYSQNYINPLLLVIVSLALGVYTLSMAASLDQWLIDRIHYRVGTDVTFKPFSEVEMLEPGGGAEWVPPIDEFRMLPGVLDAARVGDYEAHISVAAGDSQRVKGKFIGVDRVDFGRVSWFRYDLAREPLGALMNRLATQDDGILVSQKFLTDNHLSIGDKVAIHVLADFGASVQTEFTVVGVYALFPTIYEEQTVVIGNLEHLFSFFGMTMPHSIWLRLQPGADGATVLEKVLTTGIGTLNNRITERIIEEEQAKMERVGVFGTLSVGFGAAAFMAALGLLTYSYSSLHERLYVFSVLRSIGLKRFQIIHQVALEYAILIAYGALAGVMAGAVAAELFVPLFRVTGEQFTPQPPLLPIIAREQIWPLALIFTSLMIILEMGIISAAIYQRLSNALRLGHQG